MQPDQYTSLPQALIARHGLEVRESDDRTIHVIPTREIEDSALDEIAFLTGLEVILDEGGAEGMRALPETEGPSRDETSPGRNSGLPRLINGSGTVGLLDALLKHAAIIGASDVHIEPYETRVRIRLRRDGVLHAVGEVPLHQKEAVVARVKIMASLDIAEKRRPQDGRLRFEHAGRHIDVRVSTLPAAYGEKAVLRLLDRSSVILDLGKVGLEGRDFDAFESAISAPHGMIVVTGPTGSGKTTTLYAALAALNRDDLNVLTAEDPVEYDLPGVNQVRVRPDIGFSFAEALRAFLRQDPDVVMVGEIRDRETADIAVRAALTGHLVLTTLHTNDASTAVTRLADMGVEPYLLAASLRLVAAQRLVRRVCEACSEEVETSPADIERLGATAPLRHARGSGCAACAETGYEGRAALFELIPVGETMAERIAAGDTAARLRTLARNDGARSLREAGCEAIRRGITTPEEVIKATA